MFPVILVPVNTAQLYYEVGNTGPQILAQKHFASGTNSLS